MRWKVELHKKEYCMIENSDIHKPNSKEFYKTIINNVDVIIQINEIVGDEYFKMVWANKYFRDNYFIERSKNQNIELVCNPMDFIKVEIICNELYEPNRSFSSIIKCKNGNGQNKWYYSNIKPYVFNSGKLKSVLCAFIDITGKIFNPERIVDMRKEIAQLKNKVKLSQLSKTEKNILKFLASGNSEKEIAEIQSRSIHTIKTHLKNIRKELCMSKNTELVKFAVETGII